MYIYVYIYIYSCTGSVSSSINLQPSEKEWVVADTRFCITLQRTATHCKHTTTHCNTLHHNVSHFNTLQHTATHCNTLQHTATHCITLHHTAMHCNALQHTATHCNTLQHTATTQWVSADTSGRICRRASSWIWKDTHFSRNAYAVARRWALQVLFIAYVRTFVCVCVCVCLGTRRQVHED